MQYLLSMILVLSENDLIYLEAVQSEADTYRAASEICSLVRLSGWLMAVIPYILGSSPSGKLVRSMALFMMFRNAPMACQPLLLNQI